MNTLLLLLAMALLMAAPKLWARHIFDKHNQDRSDLPASGGELASKQLAQLQLSEVHLVEADNSNHYDPETKSVYLNDSCMHNHSLTALVQAAYEVGHALQDRKRAALSDFRSGLLQLTAKGEQLGSFALILSPLVALLNMDIAGLLLFFAVVSMLAGTLVQLMILPLELQAGFEFGLPLLKDSARIKQQDQDAVRQLMTACALSHFANALANLLDCRHWLKALGFKPKQPN